jgi:hypothetical protein
LQHEYIIPRGSEICAFWLNLPRLRVLRLLLIEGGNKEDQNITEISPINRRGDHPQISQIQAIVYCICEHLCNLRIICWGTKGDSYHFDATSTRLKRKRRKNTPSLALQACFNCRLNRVDTY